MFFDWANQPWYTLIVTYVFGPYFVSRVAADPVHGQAVWGYTIAAASLVVALTAPVLGAIADAVGGIVGEARIVERAFALGPCALTEAVALLQDRLANAET